MRLHESANHALQRTRRERRGGNPGVLLAGSLSLGSFGNMKRWLLLFVVSAGIGPLFLMWRSTMGT